MWPMRGVGPMFRQLGFFHKFAGKDYDDKRPRDRHVDESKRLLGVLDQRLSSRAMDHGRRLHDCRHRDLSVGAQPDRFLWRRRAGGNRQIFECHAGARCVRRAPCGRKGAEHSEARVILAIYKQKHAPALVNCAQAAIKTIASQTSKFPRSVIVLVTLMRYCEHGDRTHTVNLEQATETVGAVTAPERLSLRF